MASKAKAVVAPMPATGAAAIWAALLIGAAIVWPVALPWGDTALSLFDPLAVGIAGALFLARPDLRAAIARPMLYAGVTALLIAAHSGLLLGLSPPGGGPVPAEMLRAAVKTGAILALSVSCLAIFRTVRTPAPFALLLGVLLAAAVVYVGLHLTRHTDLPWFGWVPRTSFVLVLLGMAVLRALDGAWRRDTGAFRETWLLWALATALSFVLQSKIGAAVGAIGLVTVTLAGASSRPGRPVLLLGMALAALAMFAGLYAAGLLQRIDGPARSITVRLDLWAVALDGMLRNGGLGAGLGQFPVLVGENPALAADEHRYAHSVPLGIMAQLGVAGVAVVAAMVLLLWSALRRAPRWDAFLVLLYLVPMALLHDTYSNRMVILVAMLALAWYGPGAVRGGAGAPDRRSVAPPPSGV